MKLKKAFGFTLVEVLLSMALMVLVGGVLYLMQSTGMSTVTKGATQLLLSSEIRNKLEKISNDLRCAKEVINVKPNMIKIRTYKYSPEDPEPGEAALITVSYELEHGEKRDILWRTQNRDNPVKLIEIEHIAPDIFMPFYELQDELSPTGWSFEPFDMVSNDSWKRQKISFIKLKFDFRQRKESALIVTSVALEPAMSRIRQANWKIR